jgi:hypothetical protein
MTREGLAKISDTSALPVRGNEIAVHQTLSFQPHEAGDLVMVMLKNYPDGRERLSSIDTCRVCAVNRGLPAAAQTHNHIIGLMSRVGIVPVAALLTPDQTSVST